MSRVTPPVLPPLELDGIRYAEIRTERCDDDEHRSGYMRATRIKDRVVLWEQRVYEVIREENPIIAMDQDIFFIRFKFMPDQQHILVENERRQRYFVNIHTQAVREATDADFPPELIYQPKQPHYIRPIVYRGLIYTQELNGFFVGGRNKRSGYLVATDIKTQRDLYKYQIYTVPFNHDIENDQQECYFLYMEFLPCKRHLLIVNQACEEYLFDIRSHQIQRFDGNRIAYHDKYLGIFNRIKYFFSDLWDNLLRKQY